MLITTKKRKLNLPEQFKNTELFVFVPFEGNKEKLKLEKLGESLVPGPDFGKWCAKNANGYSFSDHSKEKKERYVTTIYFHPWGNEDIPMKSADIYKPCYPKVYIEPTDIAISLAANSDGEMYFATKLEKGCSEINILTAINIFVEIFGSCTLNDKLDATIPQKTIRLEWELLPPGVNPIDIVRGMATNAPKNVIAYTEERINYLTKKHYKCVGQGINGSKGYFAYVFNKICVFECAFYGNATYVVEASDWKELSKLTKKELLDEKKVLEKLVHTENWFDRIDQIFSKYEN